MSHTARHDDRLLALIDAACDGTLDEAAHAELDDLLRDNPDGCRTYLAHFRLRSDIYLLDGAKRAGTTAKLQLAAELQEIGEEPAANSSQQTAPTSRSKKSLLDRASRQPVRPALAIAALVMISVVAWMGVTMVKTQIAGGGKKNTDKLHKPTKPEFVAWLMKAHETQWLDGTEPQKTKLMPGQRLAIASGLIEIQYRTRAVVVIEGPAEFYVGGKSGNGKAESGKEDSSLGRKPIVHKQMANSGFLSLGKLVARVEGEDAKGFTVKTPTATVEDLGTEFAVELSGDGGMYTEVLEGKIRLKHDGIWHTLAVGNALSIVGGTLLVDEPSGRRFHRSLPAVHYETTPIIWQTAQPTTGKDDLISGDVVFAVNGGPHDVTIDGTTFETNSLGLGFTKDVYGVRAMTSTGDKGFDALIGSFTYGGGDTAAITISDLIPETKYRVQCFFNDQRPGYSDRVITCDNDTRRGNGNEVDLAAGATADPGPSTDYGNNVIGEFTARATRQQFALRVNGFLHAHFNAILVTAQPPSEDALLKEQSLQGPRNQLQEETP